MTTIKQYNSAASVWQTIVVGAQGPQGYQGSVGAQGYQGSVGAQGYQGSVGTQGYQGSVGAQGFQGSVGAQGVQGSVGPQGFQGSVGPQGYQGSVGSQGYQGYQGSVGATGAGGVLGYYGSFNDTTTQTNASVTGTNLMTYNTTAEANGVSIVSGSRITFAYAGTYNIEFSAQFSRTNSGTDTADIWFRKNGVNLDQSDTQIVITGSTGANPIVAAWNYVLTVAAGDYVEIAWQATDTAVRILAAGTNTNPTRPAIPSVILTVQQVVYQGQQGNQGAAASITAGSVATTAYGTAASVTNSGTSSNAVFNFSIPQGAQGYQGSVGAQGSAASIAAGSVATIAYDTAASVTNRGTSSSAIFDFSIPQGPQGYQGSVGSQGYQGYQGSVGATGSFNANSAFQGPLEVVSIDTSTALSGSNAATVSIKTAGVYSFTTNPTANWTTNVRGDGSTTLASMLSVGQSVTITVLVDNGSTAYWCPSTSLRIDGTTTGVTMRWMNGATPAAGSASSTDIYTYTIVKTAATPTYSVYAAVTKFA